MHPCRKDTIVHIKDLAVIVGIGAGLLAALTNWKALFRPYAKKLEEREFEAAANLLEALRNPLFVLAYSVQEPFSDDLIKNLWAHVYQSFSSPFLPECVAKLSGEFHRACLEAGAFGWLTAHTVGVSFGVVQPGKLKGLYELHKLAHDEIILWFRREPVLFPFSAPKESNA